MGKKIFVIAGEHSGDVLGEGLMAALKARDPSLEFSGIGGPLMKNEGLKSLIPMEEICVMGLWEVLWHLPRLLSIMHGLVEEIEKFNPDIIVTIDLPDFNFQVASRLKKRGKCKAKIIHYVAPSVWAWRPGRAKKIAKFLDGLLCLFPFEPPYFTKVGLKAEFIGHPLIEENAEQANGASFRETFGIPAGVPVLGVMIGSRAAEVHKHAGIIRDVVNVVHEQYPDLEIVTPTLPALEYEVKKIAGKMDCPVCVVLDPHEKWSAFAACDVVLAVSGTVCLELAYARIPHVSLYKMHPISWILVKLLVKTKYANLANILLNEPAIPEYLQGKCNVTAVTKGVLTLMQFEEERQTQIAKTERIRTMLVADPEKSPSEKAAEFVLKIASN